MNQIEVHQPGIVEHNDAEIARAATLKLQGDRFLPADQVTATVTQGLVTLQGVVDYEFQKADAERDIKYLDGMRGFRTCSRCNQRQRMPARLWSAGHKDSNGTL